MTDSHAKKRTAFRWLTVSGTIVVVGLIIYRVVMPGLSFLLLYVGSDTASHQEISTKQSTVSTKDGHIPIKRLIPKGGAHKTALVIHGVHHKGFHEPRLLKFAHNLTRFGYAVVLPDMVELKNYRFSAKSVDDIERLARWTINESNLMGTDDKLLVAGISFAGGLSISAGSRNSISRRIAAIFSFGGHGSIEETLSYLISGRFPDGRELKPHVYGQAVIARLYSKQVVPIEQAYLLEEKLLDYLNGRNKQLKAILSDLPEETRRILSYCLNYQSSKLGALLKEKIGRFEMDASLSPVKGPVPKCPLFLLHGSDDNVIPAFQSTRLHNWASTETESHLLISGLIKHVDFDRADESPPITAYFDIIRFWTELLRSS